MKKTLIAVLALATVGAVALGLGPKPDDGNLDSKSSTQVAIDFFSQRVETNPADVISATRLGVVLRQNQRETGDLESLYRAENVLESALEALPGYPSAQLSLAQVVIDLHQFQRGLELASDIDDPLLVPEANLAAGDALLAMGRYDEALTRFSEASPTGDSPAVDARMARLAEVRGDLQGAVALMERANAELGDAVGEQVAWYATRLADLYLSAGRLDEAEAELRRAIGALPTYAPAFAGIGDVMVARGELDQAASLYEQATALATDPDWHFTLAKLYELAGDSTAAVHQSDLALATIDEYGEIHPRDFAIHYATTGQPDAAIRYAEAALAQSQDVYAHDVMAWVLYWNGDYQGALTHAEAALALGTPEAEFYYHHGAILIALGDIRLGSEQVQRALELGLDPWDETEARVLVAHADRSS